MSTITEVTSTCGPVPGPSLLVYVSHVKIYRTFIDVTFVSCCKSSSALFCRVHTTVMTVPVMMFFSALASSSNAGTRE